MSELEATPEEVVEPDYENMSDEEFEKLAPPVDNSVGSVEEETPAEEPAEEEPVIDDEEEPEAEENEDPVEDQEDPPAEEGAKPSEDAKTDDEVPPTEEPAIDYEAEYKKTMATFKANGQDMTPKNADDARRLMQMGANYHKKMAGMKPALKALKTLENNGLLDQAKLDFLIDIHQGKQEAITKLMKEKEIDPLDVDVQAESTYIPTSHGVSDAEVALDSVLESIETSPNYNKTLTAVTKEWDETSRNEAATNPQIIQVINGHMDSGIYDTVMSAVQYDRSMGKFSGVSDLEAYKMTGNRLEQEGVLKTAANASQRKAPAQAPAAIDPGIEQKRKAQKKAASPIKASKKVSKLPPNFNPLDLSDEEFEKFDKKTIGL